MTEERTRPDQGSGDAIGVALTDGWRAVIRPHWNTQWATVDLDMVWPGIVHPFHLDMASAERLARALLSAAGAAGTGRAVLQDAARREHLGVDSPEAQAEDEAVIGSDERRAQNEY